MSLRSLPLGAIVNFCSNDYPFLRHCIDAVRPFCAQIILPVCDHFFDGQPEVPEVLQGIYAEFPDVQCIEFPYDQKKSLYGSHSSIYWHNLARMIGRFYLDKEIEYALFLDADEIADTARFLEWIKTFPYSDYEAIRFSNYWYFRSSTLQAKTWEDSPLLVKKEKVDGKMLMDERERPGMYDAVSGAKARSVPGSDGAPLFHHFSWVRTKQQLLRKVKSWGHNWERDWEEAIEQEFAHPFAGTDFIHGYAFSEVSPFIAIDLEKKHPVSSERSFPHLLRLKHADVVKIDVSLTYEIPLSGRRI